MAVRLPKTKKKKHTFPETTQLRRKTVLAQEIANR